MLFNIPVSPSLGYSSMPKNVGSMRNNGFEINLTYQVINTKDITWDINANITFQGNKVLKLAPEILDENGYWKYSTIRWYKEGEPMYQYYLPQFAGVDPESGYSLFWAKRTVTNEAGEEVEELYKTPEYQTARDTYQVSTGNMMPKAYGGFGTTVTAYGFDLSAAFSYQLGGKIIDSGYQNLMHTGNNIGMAWHKDAMAGWTPQNTNTNVPALQTNPKYSYANATSDRFLISSNYLALNDIQLGYTFPTKWVSKLGLSDLRIYCAAENVALWSKRKGLDPRQGFTSSQNYTYAPIRTVSGGLRVNF